MKIKKAWLYLLWVLAGTPAVAQQILPLDPAVRTGRLTNGFTYYIRHNRNPENRAVFYLVNKVGSVLEEDNERGLAHFMEHMNFNGTAHFPKNDLIDYLQKAGVKFGADLNAYTSFDETIYQLPVPTKDSAVLKNAFLIMHDWAQFATLDPEEIDKERGVILEEKRLSQGVGDRLRKQYFPVLLNNAKYVNRLPIGTDEVLNTFTPATLRNFYQKWYRPDLQALIVVGDIDVNAIEKLIKRDFSDLKSPVPAKPRIRYTIPLTGKNQFIALTDPELTDTRLEVYMKQRGNLAIRTETDLRNNVIRSLYNMMLGERYSQLLRKADPPYREGGASISTFWAGIDVFQAAVTAHTGELESGFKAMWREAERVKQLGFTAAELERAKRVFSNNMENALKEKGKANSVSFVNEYTQHFLKGNASPGIDLEYKVFRRIFPGIQLADVNALSKKYMTGVNMDIIIMAPAAEKNKLPDEETVNAWMGAVAAEKTTPYKDIAVQHSLLSVMPAPGKIEQERYYPGIGVTALRLGNGVSVLIKPTTFRNNEVFMKSYAPGGTSCYADEDYMSAVNSTALIGKSGVGDLSNEQLLSFLIGRTAYVQPGISDVSQNISAYSTPADLETVFQLAYLYHTQPRKDEVFYQAFIKQSIAALDTTDSNPEQRFTASLDSILSDSSVRFSPMTLKKIRDIRLDRSYQIYKELFGGASSTTFVFTGNVDTAVIKDLAVKYLAALPAGVPHVPKDLGIHSPDGIYKKTIYAGREQKAEVKLFFCNAYDYNEINNRAMDALTEVLENRLLERLREQEGGVYTPAVQVGYNKFTARCTIQVTFGCKPENTEKLIAATLEEIEKIKKAGPSADDLKKYKAEAISTHETQLQDNIYWLNYLTTQVENNDPLEQVNDFDSTVNSVTKEKVMQMAEKYLQSKNYLQGVLMPEK